MFFRCSVPKLTVAMVPAPLSDSQESNLSMSSARDQEHYVTRRIPRTPNFCGHTLRDKGKLAATSHDWKTVLTNSHSKAHGCQGSGSTLGLSRKQLAHELREGSGALRDETHPADSNFLQTETRGRKMSIDVHPSLRRCLEKKSNSQDHRNEKTRSRRYEKL